MLEMATPTRSVLHVLRLVWRAQSVGSFSTVARLTYVDEPKTSSFFASDSPALVEKINPISPIDFLETATEDYQAVSLDLPHRKYKPVVLPWPTVFAPKTPSIPAEYDFHSNFITHSPTQIPDLPQSKSKVCDPLARLVLVGNIKAARAVHEDLRNVKAKIQERLIYIHPAITCLKANDTEGFLFWLSLYPNRPAMKDHPGLRQQWYPVIFRILGKHTHDVKLITDFIYLAAQKCLLPTVIRPLLRHVVYSLPPQESIQVFEKAVELYKGTIIPHDSTTERGMQRRSVVNGLEREWWNEYLRFLIVAGWKDDARALFAKRQGIWEESTEKEVLEELQGESVTEAVVDEQLTGTIASAECEYRHSIHHNLPKLVRHALREKITAFELRQLIAGLRRVEDTHPTFIKRFHRRFIRPPSHSLTNHTNVAKEATWWQATSVFDQYAGNHQAVIRTFRERFLWVGLPPVSNIIKLDEPKHSVSLLQPNINDINATLPSILGLFPISSAINISSFHTAYLAHARSLPPSLRPNGDTHYKFIRAFDAPASTKDIMAGLQRILEAGYDPDDQACSFILERFVKDRNLKAFRALLNRMETREPIGDEGVRISMPSLKTYRKLVRFLQYPVQGKEESARMVAAAEDVGRRAVRLYGDEWRHIS